MNESATIWLVIFCLGIGSFGLRYVFLGVIGDRNMPEWVLRHLRYTAVAVLPGLVAPLVIWPAATDGQPDPARMAAAAAALVVGYVSKNVLGAVAAGAGTLFCGLYFF